MALPGDGTQMTQFEAYIDGFNKALGGYTDVTNPYGGDEQMLSTAWATGLEQAVGPPEFRSALLETNAYENPYD
jgi:hypothetical protein